MLYATGIYALNVHRPTDTTTGDWHPHLKERPPMIANSAMSPIADEHILKLDPPIVLDDGTVIEHVADHMRACLDLMSNGTPVDNMRLDVLDDESLNQELFSLARKICEQNPETPLNKLMEKQYRIDWVLSRDFT